MSSRAVTPQTLARYGIHQAADVVYNPSYELLFAEETRADLPPLERGTLTSWARSTSRPVNSPAVRRRTNTSCATTPRAIPSGGRTTAPARTTTSRSPGSLAASENVGGQPALRQAFVRGGRVLRRQRRHAPESALHHRGGLAGALRENMFIRPSDAELADFEPDFVVMNGAKCTNPDWQQQGLHSENFVAFNLTERMQLIGGTWYGGEMKKGLFSIMNYLLPLKGIASMHCSANVGEQGDVAVFFGLSGTGKTTLSTDPKRQLIGDDEHGWDDDGVFNFEGGCYAKTIKLSPQAEPEIYQAIRRDALLENVTVLADGSIDFDDASKTENTRVSYPIYHIENIVKPVSKAGHARKIIFLTADAFGVLPPVSRLTPEQTQYHFLSGFTAKLAGTERGITAPTPTFSLLRRRVPDAAPDTVCRSAGETHGGRRRPGLPGQHRLERQR